jgi:L-asparagine permease
MVTVCVYLVGVLLNYVMPTHVFELVLNIASLGVLSTWAFLIICQMKLRGAINRGEAKAVAFRMPWAPFTSWLTLAFLAGVVILMAFDYPDGTVTVAAIPAVAVLLTVGWILLRRNGVIMSATMPSAELTRRVFEENDKPR